MQYWKSVIQVNKELKPVGVFDISHRKCKLLVYDIEVLQAASLIIHKQALAKQMLIIITSPGAHAVHLRIVKSTRTVFKCANFT